VRGSRLLARRLGVFGLGSLVVGAVLLGSGVTVSAHNAAGAAVAPQKKKPPPSSTPSTTPTTMPTTTTSTAPLPPCTPAPTTATGVNTTVTPNTTATLTMDPGTCIVDGTVVSLTGSGFVDGALGVFLECNSDSSQPTATSNDIPVSCTSVSSSQGPGIVKLSPTGTVGPDNFTVKEGTVGPPCAPSCVGALTDSSGGSSFADAARYPCPPTPAQQAAGDTCEVLFGDSSGDAVIVPISFNVAVPPPPATVSTAAPTSPSGSGATPAPAAKATSTKASTAALAFTGPGPGLVWLAVAGAVLMVLGLLALAVVDQPRRTLRVVAKRAARSRPSP